MKPDHWQQLDRLFQSALRRGPAERAAFLDEACAGDNALRKQAEALLAAHNEAGSFIESPAIEVEAREFAADRESAVGEIIGHYRVISSLGSGGMGEVYLAQDTALSRQVALKLLPEYFAEDRNRLGRFHQEARAASTLNHPNIITIFEIGEFAGRHFIVTEFIDGLSLRQHLVGEGRHTLGKQLQLDAVLDIAIQTVDALAAAHEAHIAHRDIKPENIMLRRRDGYVKVLDFGLAKVARPAEQALASDIATQVKTNPGTVLGTVQYMSPEQALGREVDHRTDIFSFGVVLYEMVTGKLPFPGTTAAEITDHIIHAQPEAIGRFNYNVPAELERIIRKCLEKERERRYQSMRELLVDLKNLKRDTSPGAGRAQQARKHRSRKAIDSLAVLPFVNASADPNTEYLSDGITGSIISSLSQLRKLRVMARGTVFSYKGREVDPQDVGHQLGVRAVLTGRVLQLGERLVISAELVDTSNGTQLWGAQYNRTLSDIFVMQEEVAKEIVEKLRLRLMSEDKKRLGKRHTSNAEAYQLYLKGRYFWNKTTKEGFHKAIEYFKRAIQVDSSYAMAHAGLADCYSVLSNFSTFSPNDVLPKAKAAAMRALEIDDTLAEAHTSLAYIKLIYDWDWEQAEREFKRAIELGSNEEWVYEAYGWYLAAVGRFDESVAEMKRAREIDPLSIWTNTCLGIPFYYSRHYDEAIEQFRIALEMEPTFYNTRFRLGLAYIQKGMYEEAIAQIQQTLSASGDRDALAALGHVYAISGQSDNAQGALAELKERFKQEYIPAYDVAIIHVGLGETDQAFEWLEQAYNERSYGLTFLGVDPILDSLRSDSRYQDLLRRIGLAA